MAANSTTNGLSGAFIRKVFIAGLIVQLITAWYSAGYHHPDEHFQILEFCSYKLKQAPASALSWEFAAQCRPAIQPLIAFCISKLLYAIGLFDPFIVAFLLRALIGLFAWWVTKRIVLLLLPEFKTKQGAALFVLSSFLLWFVPYITVRYSAENLGGTCFFLALSLLMPEAAKNRRTLYLLAAGALLGLTLFLRLQMGFAYIGLAIWMLFIKKWRWDNYVLLIAGGLIGIGLSVLADHWMYGNWVLTPLNYFKVNIIQHKAADFGVYPWWYYIWLFIQIGIPPISIVLLGAFVAGVWKKPLHLFSLVALTFLLGHFAIGHKELRFLFPIITAFIFLSSVGIDALLYRYPDKRYYKPVWIILVVVNIAMLAFRAFTPAQEVMDYYAYIYHYNRRYASTTLVAAQDPYKLVGLPVNFYKPKHLNTVVLQQLDSIQYVLQQANGPVLYMSTELSLPKALVIYKHERVYCLFPDWILRFNVNNWEERSRIWAIYRIYPATGG